MEGVLKIKLLEGQDLMAADRSITGKRSSDPYVKFKLDYKRQKAKSEVKKETLNPVWDQDFVFEIHNKKTDFILIKCKDWDLGSKSDDIGNAILKIDHLVDNVPTKVVLKLEDVKTGDLHLLVTFIPRVDEALVRAEKEARRVRELAEAKAIEEAMHRELEQRRLQEISEDKRREEEERIRRQREERERLYREEQERLRIELEEKERLYREEQERIRLEIEERERLYQEEQERLRLERAELERQELERLRLEEEERERARLAEEERIRQEEIERLRVEQEQRDLEEQLRREEEERLRREQEEEDARIAAELAERLRLEEENRALAEAELERLRLEEEERARAEAAAAVAAAEAESHQPVLIQSVHSGLFLGLAGPAEPCTPIVQQHFTGGEEQQWILNPDQTISPACNPELVVDISGGAASGHHLIVYPRHGGANQLFSFDGLIMMNASGLAIDIAAGSLEHGGKVIAWDRHDGPNQQYVVKRLHEWHGEWSRPITIRSVHSGMYLGLNGCVDPCTPILQFPKNDSVDQQWIFNPDRTISPVAAPDLVIDISGGVARGNPLIIYPKHGGANQKFRFANGLIVNDSGLVFDVDAWSQDAGHKIIAWENNKTANQMWVVEYAQ